METENEIPELRPNQIGITCKTINDGALRTTDETLYCSIGKNDITLELYPKKPIIIIDKDAATMLLNKIIKNDAGIVDENTNGAEVDRPEGLIPDVNRSTKDLPIVALPSDLFEGLAAKAEPLGKDGDESKAWEEFSKSGLPEIINKLLYGFGWALKFFNDEGEGFDAIPIKVEYKEKSTQQTNADAFPLELNDNSQAMNLETKLGKVDGSGGDAEEIKDLQDNGASV